ncbi:MAG: hypothetical protein R3181_07405 [Rubricoccaceae bacterium]|nr:hypothetical protein [Rubricoccaceae bacterium]
MAPALRPFLDGLIDYAGLFPPARLDLDPAIKNFARYRSGPDAWMLGRFIVPVTRLGALDDYAGLFAEAPPFRFSVLGRPAEAGDAAAQFVADVAQAQAWERRHEGRVAADRFELKLPPALAADGAALADLFARLDEAFAARDGDAARGFFEVDLLAEGHARGVEVAAAAAASHNDRAGRPAVGLKFRCGGVMPDLFPEPSALAHALVACRDAGAPFKATAGLHHPVRHHSDEVGAPMYGFLNVFGGAALAAQHGFDRAALARVLCDEDAAHFRFDDGGLWWTDDWFVPAASIADVRDRFATSYGSCSFDEPREDLRALGLL